MLSPSLPSQRLLLGLFIGLLASPFPIASSLFSSPNSGGKRLNVLLIGVDDLRPELESYGFPWMKTPSVSRLAARGTQFTRAYCQVAVCSPSRTSLLTGLRPDTTHIWTIGPYFRKEMPDGDKVKTMPQWFKEHGYNTTGIGKIFHPGSSSGGPTRDEGGADMPYSWSEPYFFCDQFTNDTVQSTAMQHFPNGTGCVQNEQCIECFTKAGTWGHPISWAQTDCPDECYPEGLIANEAIRRLAYYAEEKKVNATAGPFFLAVGFKRPHLAFKAPERYFSLYPLDDVKLAASPNKPKGLPPVAFYHNSEIHGYPDIPAAMNTSNCQAFIEDKKAQQLRRAYYSSVSLTDTHLGRVLDVLDSTGLADDTVIAFWGDHGYQLGEHGEWGKCTNFELATRVPLIVSSPQQKQKGTKTMALAELVDLFPTLTELAGVPQAPGMQGASLAPVLDDPNTSVSDASLSQFPRTHTCNESFPLYKAPMGVSLRVDSWRYTEWVKFNYTADKPHPVWSEVYGVELYDHHGDKGDSMDKFENENLAGEPAYADTVKQMHEMLVSKWGKTL